MPKRTLQGVVVSDKQDKTVVVRVDRRFTHPIYKKTVRRSKKYHAHDEKNEYRVGDMVWIEEQQADFETEALDRGPGREEEKAAVSAFARRREKRTRCIMIQMQTNLDVADNSGARRVMCIKVLGGSKRKYATRRRRDRRLGQGSDSARPREEGRRDEGRRRARAKDIRRPDGSVIRFDRNAAVLINNQMEPVGTRIFGPVPRELRAKNHMKIISLAPEVL